ncbi:MAG: hypothetical protein ACI4A7_04550 [Prevotella sp.]
MRVDEIGYYADILCVTPNMFGFSSEAYFCRYVEKYLGVPPSILME